MTRMSGKTTNKAIPWICLVSLSLASCGSSQPTPTLTIPPPVVVFAIPTSQPPTAVPTPTWTATPAASPSPSREAVPATKPPTTVAQPPATKPPASYPGRILFEAPDGTVTIINPNGSGRAKVTAGHTPLFSPDGKRVAYLASSGSGTVVTIADLDGSNAQANCLFSGTQVALVRWSPRTRYIAVNSGRLPGQISLCNSETQKVAGTITGQGTPGLVYDWTPDGGMILWQAGAVSNLDLFYGDPLLVGSDAIALTNGQNRASSGSAVYYSAARFSPDGRTVAIAGAKVFFASVPGSKSPLEGKVLQGFTRPDRLAWSPDGRALVVADAGNGSLNIVEIATGRISRLVDKGSFPDWSRY